MSISEKLASNILQNPLLLQRAMLQQYEDDIGGLIVDPNHTVGYILEMASEVTASAINEINNTTEGLYPVRAQVSTDLYKHMSDYDYVGMFGSPASCQMSIILDKYYILEKAVKYNDNYSKVVIPRNTVFTIGDYVFGLYYPIEIRVNRASRTFSVIQDTTVDNPIHTLTQNILEHRFMRDDTMEFLAISVPVYQFKRDLYTNTITASAGFNQKFSYTDRFYAVRIFTNIQDKKDPTVYNWGELSQTLSNQIYDPETPTAIVQVLTETSQVQIQIPQVYLSSYMIRGEIKIEVYSTKGAIEYTIPVIEGSTPAMMKFSTAELSDDEAKYSEPLRLSSVLLIQPIDTVITGGSNGYNFEELRENVIQDTFSVNAPITPGDVQNYFKKQGFIVTKYRDGITDRIFLCHQKVTDGVSGATIAAASLNTQFSTDIKKNVSGIIQHSSSLFTFLPSIVYEYQQAKNSCIPLSDGEMQRIAALPAAQRIAEFNNRMLTISLFHIQLDISDRYPLATAYDLRAPKVLSNEFIGENPEVITQLSLYSYSLTSVKNGTGGFDLILLISRTDDIKNLLAVGDNNIANIRVLIATTNIYQKQVWAEATYQNRVDDRDVFKLHINTDYQLSQTDGNHALWTTDTFTDNVQDGTHPIFLTNEFHIVLTLRESVLGDIGSVTKSIETSLPYGWGDYVAVSEQRMSIQLGEPIGELFNKISLAFKGEEYLKYTTTKFSVLQQTEYERDVNTGMLVYEIVDGQVVLKEAFPKGTLALVAAGIKPEFTIKDAYTSVVGQESVINGTYYAVDEKSMNALSSDHDEWQMDLHNMGVNGDEIWNYKFVAMDALRLALECCAPVPNKEQLPSRGYANMFVWVNDARVFDVDGVASIDPPIYGIVKTDGSGDDTIGRLYLWTADKWTAMVGGVSLDDTKTKVREDNATTVADSEGQPVSKDPIYHGYAYAMYLNTDSSSTLQYLSYLGMQAAVVAGDVKTGTEPLYPSFAHLIGEAQDPLKWEDHINQWPWDVTEWYRVANATFTFKLGGVEYTREYKRCYLDETINLQLVTAGIDSYTEYVSGQIILDGNGNPIIDPNAYPSTIYLIEMLHLDAKLLASTTTSYRNYPEETCGVLRSYFQTTRTVKDQLMENTRLFFEPLRSIGNGSYKNAAGQTVEMSLDITMKLRVYVSQAAASDSQLMDLLKVKIVSIIDKQIFSGTVNCADIAQILQEEVPDTVQYVDILGINDDPDLQTLIFADEHVRPHLKHELVLLEDGTVDVNRGLHLEIVVQE